MKEGEAVGPFVHVAITTREWAFPSKDLERIFERFYSASIPAAPRERWYRARAQHRAPRRAQNHGGTVPGWISRG